MGEVVGRTAELSAISRMLDLTSEQPAALVLEGEAGIGKTTLLRAGVELASVQTPRGGREFPTH